MQSTRQSSPTALQMRAVSDPTVAVSIQMPSLLERWVAFIEGHYRAVLVASLVVLLLSVG